MSPFLPQKKKEKDWKKISKDRAKKEHCSNFAAKQVIPTAGNSHIMQAFLYHINKSVCVYLCRRDDILEMPFSEIKHAIATGVHFPEFHRKNEKAASSTDGSRWLLIGNFVSGHE